MGIDFSYANPKASALVVDFETHDKEKGYPPGTSRAAVETVQRYASYKDAEKHLNAQQKEAWNDWYYKEVIQPENWKKLVEEYKKKVTTTSAVKPPPFNNKSDWIPDKHSTNSGLTPPTVPTTFKGDPAAPGGLGVNTQALEWFAKDVLGPMLGADGVLQKTALQVDKVDPKPGAFARAELLRRAVVGSSGIDGGLKRDTRDMLYNVEKSLDAVRLALLEMAKQYKNTEDLNKLSTADLDKVMGDAFKGLQGLSGFGTKEYFTDGG